MTSRSQWKFILVKFSSLGVSIISISLILSIICRPQITILRIVYYILNGLNLLLIPLWGHNLLFKGGGELVYSCQPTLPSACLYQGLPSGNHLAHMGIPNSNFHSIVKLNPLNIYYVFSPQFRNPRIRFMTSTNLLDLPPSHGTWFFLEIVHDLCVQVFLDFEFIQGVNTLQQFERFGMLFFLHSSIDKKNILILRQSFALMFSCKSRCKIVSLDLNCPISRSYWKTREMPHALSPQYLLSTHPLKGIDVDTITHLNRIERAMEITICILVVFFL